MYHFKIVPVDRPAEVVKLASDEMHLIFDVVEGLQSPLVDVLRDEDYVFSFRQFGGPEGYWTIFHREEES